jgi:hypothetical protein
MSRAERIIQMGVQATEGLGAGSRVFPSKAVGRYWRGNFDADLSAGRARAVVELACEVDGLPRPRLLCKIAGGP